ncbi:hypothetical protein [Brachybacterium sp. GPGPB12]|uniref:hypothetical protein n=1 Tax=Brachybacterium sp. GPGPB12 TaxID=3023517 RepID=UPI0031344358
MPRTPRPRRARRRPRERLETARVLDTGGVGADLQLVVEDPRRLAVPRQQQWPVRGEFLRGGIRYELELQIDGGRLGMLSVMVPDEEPRLEHALSQLASPAFVRPIRTGSRRAGRPRRPEPGDRSAPASADGPPEPYPLNDLAAAAGADP